MAFIFLFLGTQNSFAHSENWLPREIKVEIEAISTVYTDNSPIEVAVKYENVGNTNVRFLLWGTALEDQLRDDLFRIERDDVAITYLGPDVKRMPPRAENHIELAPGESVSNTVRIDSAYDFSVKGDYSITYNYSSDRATKLGLESTVEISVLNDRSTFKRQPSFRSCNSTEQRVIDSSLSAAESIASRARNDLAATPVQLRGSADRYKEWFGAYEPSRWATVQSNFVKIASNLSTETLTFDCACAAGDSDTVAYIYRSQPNVVYLCPIFWQRPTSSGADSKAGILVHEVSHFTQVANTDDIRYGQTNSKALARSNPSDAIRNADSYEYFAENPTRRSMPTAGSGTGDTENPSEPSDPISIEPPKPKPTLMAVIEFLLSDGEGYSGDGGAPGGGDGEPGPSSLTAAGSTQIGVNGWVQTRQHRNIVYFLLGSPAKIIRYDLSSKAFLDEIVFSSLTAATTFDVDDSGIYVGFGREISKYSLSGSYERHMANTLADSKELFLSDTHVHVIAAKRVLSINKVTFASSLSNDWFYSSHAFSWSQTTGRLFARSDSVSPSDIIYTETELDGTFSTTWLRQVDSPYHGDYPVSDRTYLFPDEARIVDGSGTIYSTGNLNYLGSLGGAITDLAFYGELPIVLREDTLFVYDNSLLPAGQVSLSGVNAEKIAVGGDSVFVYALGNTGVLSVYTQSLDSISPAQPGDTIDPTSLSYDPDEIHVARDDQVLFLSKKHKSVFRWKTDVQAYAESISLLGVPEYSAYSIENNTIYLAYSTGLITKVDLDAVVAVEEPMVNLPIEPLGLVAIGQNLLAIDPSGAWVSHLVYSDSGQLLSQKEWNYQSRELTWNAANDRLYHFRDGSSPNDILWEHIDTQGNILSQKDSPYHGSFIVKPPLRVSPDGQVVLIGTGIMFDGITLSLTGSSLSNDIVDAIWVGQKLYTLKQIETTVLQTWVPNEGYRRSEEQLFAGTPLRLLKASGDNGLSAILVTMSNGRPVVTNLQLD